MVTWAQRLSFPWERLVRSGVYAMVRLIVLVQTVGSAGWLIDHVNGNFNSKYASPQYFDLATMQRIVNTTDQLAQRRHLAHVYIDIYGDDESSVRYLAQFAHTPMEVIDAAQCLVVPGVQSGPVVYVTDSNRPDLDALLQRYTTATRVGEIEHPGGMPFKMYILSTRPETRPALQWSGGVQLLSQKADVVSAGTGNPQLVVTRWRVQNTVTPQPRLEYEYRFLTRYHTAFVSNVVGNRSNNNAPICHLSRTWAGDDIIPLFEFNGNAPSHMTVGIQKYTSMPMHYDHGSLKMVIYDNNVDTPRVVLRTAKGKSTIHLSLP